MSIIDIKSNADDPRAVRLSNFTSRKFSFPSLKFGSLEGGLQGFKEKDPEKQKESMSAFLNSGMEGGAGSHTKRQHHSLFEREAVQPH